MFCPKCGATLPEGSQFCTTCGAQLGAPAPQQQYAQPAPRKPLNINVGKVSTVFVAILCFIFGFLPVIHIGESIGLLYGKYGFSMFDVNALLGIAKIFVIIQIVAFAIYLISQVIDVNKYLNLPFKLSEKMPLIYFCIYALTMVLALIGCIIEKGVSPAVCWYFAIVFCLCGFVLVLKPNLLDGLIKKPQ